MVRRMGLWAFAGLAVGVFWALFFSLISSYSLNFSLRTVIGIAIRITIPISCLGRKIPITYYSSILLNVATYALLALALEPLWRRKKILR